jgi:hypothetical protein
MTVGLSLSQRDQEAHQIEARQRVERLRAFSPDQMAVGLIWLSGYDPCTFDAVLDAVASCAGDEDAFGREPEPVCGTCGEKIGIFLRLGLDWRHYRETRDALLLGSHRDTVPTIGQIELFEPGHPPVVTWRLFDGPAVQR